MPEPQVNPQKVRVGLVIVVVTLVVALVALALIDSPLGRAVMAGIIVLALIRAWLLYRAVRAGAADGAGS